ncbi:MAG: hypothetical protein KDC07_11610, partial [Chitinophagaceae bacterium]|nr:hypothetical protein [Chitinophagaceae bacterium]
MQKLILTLALCFITATSIAKSTYGGGRNNSSCSKFYIGLSTGINNESGLLGVNFDVPVTGYFSLGAGLGLSSWGYKSYGEARFYFSECNRGWALGLGATYNTGLQDMIVEMPTTIGTTDVTMDWQPVANIMFSGYRFFNLGRGGHRFYLQLGWSQRMNSTPYVVTSNHVLTSDGTTA